jgi:hypothetical protein
MFRHTTLTLRGSRFTWFVALAAAPLLLAAPLGPVLAATRTAARTLINSAPVISGAPATSVVAGKAYSFRPVATDANGDRLTFSIANKPAWATFNSSTGLLQGAPLASRVGTYSNIVVKVSDGKVSAALPAFSIVVSPVIANRAPTIAGVPATAVLTGSAYVFQPTAADADGNALTFTIQGLPAWASFNTSTGLLQGVPAAGSAGTYAGIVIAVSDGKLATALPAFGIVVTKPNAAPKLSGTPVTAGQSGQPYAFRPTASDADDDALTFAIANKPAWMTFEPSTGLLYGTPSASDVGTYGSIVVSVSDGKASAALPAFSVTVALPPTRTATLRWTAPTQNVDGTALTNLAGYQVSYGTASKSYCSTLAAAAGVTSVVIEGLEPGTWYFAVKAVNAAGKVSEFSNEAAKLL